MPARPCLGLPGRPCGVLTRNGSRCPSCQQGHQRSVDQRRGTPTQRGYGPAWQALVAQAKAEQIRLHGHAFCVDCGHQGSRDNPLSGDHIIPKARGGQDVLSNVAIRCRVHNSARRPNPRTARRT